MPEIQIPFPLKGIPIKPEMTGRVKVDETLIQTLSALCGWNGEARRLLTCALNGSLHTTSPPAYEVTNKTSTGDAEAATFASIPTTEIIVFANPNNTGDIWANLGTAAGVDTGWLLQKGDSLNISINNLQDLRLYIALTGDKVMILRTV